MAFQGILPHGPWPCLALISVSTLVSSVPSLVDKLNSLPASFLTLPLFPLCVGSLPLINCLGTSLIATIYLKGGTIMRYTNWDVLLFAESSKVPIQEFKTNCFAIPDPGIPTLTVIPHTLGINLLRLLQSLRPLLHNIKVMDTHSSSLYLAKFQWLPVLCQICTVVALSESRYTAGRHRRRLEARKCSHDLMQSSGSKPVSWWMASVSGELRNKSTSSISEVYSLRHLFQGSTIQR